MAQPQLIDLFCGAGLLSAGFTAAGFEPRLALDMDPNAVRSYNRNILPVARHGSAADLRAARCQILLAGPPCQGFSTLGAGDPADERNRLCLHVARWAKTTTPKVVVVENVPPFLDSAYAKRMSRALEALDYEITTWILDAADYGAPQHRERAFTIASKIGIPRMPRRRATVVVDRVFQDISAGDPMHFWPEPSDLALRRFRRIPEGGDWRNAFLTDPGDCPKSWRRLGTHATDIWGRIKLGKPGNTLKSRFQNPSLGRYIHPNLNRVISVREGARIQGVPDTWEFEGHRESIVRQIGNGVPIPLSRAIARAIGELFA